MDVPLPAWLGALAGMIVAVAIYVPVVRIVERRLRARSGPKSIVERAAFDDRLSVMRRIALGIDIAILAALGYWLGGAIGGR